MKYNILCDTQNKFYYNYLLSINSFLNLTKMELKLVAKWMSLKGEMLVDDEKLFSREVRNSMMEYIGVSKENLNNYVSVLTKKSILVRKDNGKLEFNDKIFIKPGAISITYNIVFNGNNG